MIKLRGSRHLLGLALDERMIHVAELRGDKVVKSARFDLPQEIAWDKPEALGAALGAFLREHGFAARRAAAGLPGRWLLTRPQVVPPTAQASTTGVLAGVLRLAIEREFTGDHHDWAFDYAGRVGSDGGGLLLLAGVLRQRLDQVGAVLQHAGLTLRTVSATPVVLAAKLAGKQQGSQAVLMLAPDSAQWALVQNGHVVSLERLAVTAAQETAGGLSAEIRRVQTMATLKSAQPPEALNVWNTSELSESALSALGRELRLPVRTHRNGTDPAIDAAAAVARAALAGGQVDFLHSRLEQARRRRFTRKQMIVAAGVVLLLALGAYLGIDTYIQQRAVDDLHRQLSELKPVLAEAKIDVDRLHMVRGWYEQRPQLLECLRALTSAFPASGQAWATSLAVHDDMTGTLAGKASDERALLGLLDRLRGRGGASADFTNVKLLYQRQNGRAGGSTGSGGGVSFAVTFTFTGKGRGS